MSQESSQKEDNKAKSNSSQETKRYNEHTSVYDVVAGRLPPRLLNQVYEDKGTHVKFNQIRPSSADDVLAKFADDGVNVPVEFHPDLPSSDLLKALHYYTGEYFRHHDNYEGYRTLDETAMLSLGILIEEAIKDILGPHGALEYAEDANDIS